MTEWYKEDQPIDPSSMEFEQYWMCLPAKSHKKKRKLVIEGRYIAEKDSFYSKYFTKCREWHVIRKYKTERARQTALEALQKKTRTSPYAFESDWEYRIP